MTENTTSRISLKTAFGIVLSITFMLVFYKTAYTNGLFEKRMSFPQIKNRLLNRTTSYFQTRKESSGAPSESRQEKNTSFSTFSSYPNTTLLSSTIKNVEIESTKILPK